MVAKLRDEFNYHSSFIMKSFHRWCSTPIHIDAVNGANFDDVYVKIGRMSKQRNKSENNNVYTTIPGKLSERPTAAERRRIIRFVTT